MFKDTLVKTYKKIVPPVLDRVGVYDHAINNNQHKLVAPMYHRVISSVDEDPFNMGMCVTEDRFSEQLAYYRDNFTPTPLAEYVTNTNKQNDNNAYISLTFDDGYKDNIIKAVPLLQQYNVNATFFICCSIFTDHKEFWWDTIINAFASCNQITIDVSPYQNILQREQIEVNNSNRKNLCIEILDILWTINDAQLIQEIAEYIEDNLVGEVHKIDKLTESDIKTMYNAGFEIGAHTLTHTNLKLLSTEDRRKELIESKNKLEDITGGKVHGFAYPAGYQDHQIEKLVYESGFKYAVSTINGINHKLKPYSIERFGVPETSLADIKRCIYNYCKA
jgi:peptidoglycan/xylan/chitin deacetylase (PgdA/CDA1 family)